MQQYFAIFNTFLAVFLTIVLLKKENQSNRILAFIMFSVAVISLLRFGFFIRNELLLVYLPLIVFPAGMLLGPLIKLYTDTLLFSVQFKVKWLWHAVPALFLILSHICILYYFPEGMTVDRIIQMDVYQKRYTTFIHLSETLSISVYLVFVSNSVRKYVKISENRFSSEMIVKIAWLRNFLLAVIGIVILWAVIIIYCLFVFNVFPVTIWEDMAILICIMLFLYSLMNQQPILPLSVEDLSKRNNKLAPKSKYTTTNLSADKCRMYARHLDQYLQKEQPYLEDNLTMPHLARNLDIPMHHLSIVINQQYEQNFYNFINQRRIEYAQSLLRDQKEQDETILMIAYRSGFQSKSAFNRAFKKFTNVTPREYIKKNQVSEKDI